MDLGLAAVDIKALTLAAHLAAIAFVGAMLTGVFRAGNVEGPSRMGRRDWPPLLLVIGGMGYLLYMAALLMSLKGLLAARHLPTDQNDLTKVPSDVLTIADACGRLAWISTTLLLIHLVGRDADALGVRARQIPTGIAQGVVAAVVALPLVLLCEMILTWVSDVDHVHPLLTTLGSTPGWKQRLLIETGITVLAPVSEELFFRACVQTFFLRALLALASARQLAPKPARWMRWAAIFASATVFTLFHEPWSYAPIFVLAVCLGYVYERTGNLWVSVTIHAAFNTASTVMFLRR